MFKKSSDVVRPKNLVGEMDFMMVSMILGTSPKAAGGILMLLVHLSCYSDIAKKKGLTWLVLVTYYYPGSEIATFVYYTEEEKRLNNIQFSCFKAELSGT